MTAPAALLNDAFPGMGTQFTLSLPDGPGAARRLRLARRWLSGFENRLSRFISYSELSRMNASAGRPFRASPLLFDFVRRNLQLAEESGGVFDPTVLAPLEAAGYDRTFAEIGQNCRESRGKPGIAGHASVRLNPKTREILLPEGAGIDSGGVGKGWAADRVASILRSPCLVDLGGDIAARGRPPGDEGWYIGVQNPHEPNADLLTISVVDKGVATSSILKRRWPTASGYAHHLIDTRTGEPAETDADAVTVVAGNALLADFHAKVALLKGASEGLQHLQSLSGVEGLIVQTGGRLLRTSGLAGYVVSGQ